MVSLEYRDIYGPCHQTKASGEAISFRCLNQIIFSNINDNNVSKPLEKKLESQALNKSRLSD